MTGLGGTIEVEPVQPHGTRFCVVLPCRPVHSTPTAPLHDRASPGPHPKRLRLLVAEDEGNLARSIADALQECEVTLVHSSAAAIAALEQGPFDAVLLDVHLPDGIGGEVVRWLRENRRESRDRVILMIGTNARPPAEAEDAGWPLLRRPFDHEALRRELERFQAS